MMGRRACACVWRGGEGVETAEMGITATGTVMISHCNGSRRGGALCSSGEITRVKQSGVRVQAGIRSDIDYSYDG